MTVKELKEFLSGIDDWVKVYKYDDHEREWREAYISTDFIRSNDQTEPNDQFQAVVIE